jgi:cytochrome c-type biogenesis protein CcmH/NrfG
MAELQGFPEELGAAVAMPAGEAAAEGDLEVARGILEGLVVTNPRDALAWAMLSQVVRRLGEAWVAVLCAEAAARLAPDDRQVRLARCEALLAVPAEAGRGRDGRAAAARDELAELARGGDAVSVRAGALLRALGG